jgi:hypothetical protein
MKPRTEKSMQLYDEMVRRGYPKEFCEQVTLNLNTDWTANRMLGYLSHYPKLPLEEVADEMLSILSDRNHIMQKKELESTNEKWNEFLNNGFDDEDD